MGVAGIAKGSGGKGVLPAEGLLAASPVHGHDSKGGNFAAGSGGGADEDKGQGAVGPAALVNLHGGDVVGGKDGRRLCGVQGGAAADAGQEVGAKFPGSLSAPLAVGEKGVWVIWSKTVHRMPAASSRTVRSSSAPLLWLRTGR